MAVSPAPLANGVLGVWRCWHGHRGSAAARAASILAEVSFGAAKTNNTTWRPPAMNHGSRSANSREPQASAIRTITPPMIEPTEDTYDQLVNEDQTMFFDIARLRYEAQMQPYERPTDT